MTKKEQQKLDNQLADIADKLIMDGWKACNAITEEYYLRLLEIMHESIDVRIDYIKERRLKTDKAIVSCHERSEVK